MNTNLVTGTAYMITVESDCFEKIRFAQKEFDIKFPKVEALFVELFADNDKKCKQIYFGFEGMEEKYHNLNLICDSDVKFENEEQLIIDLITCEDFFPDELVIKYLKEKHKMQ